MFGDGEDHSELEKQLLIFPSKKAHDDRADALSLIAMLHDTIYGEPEENYEFEVVDSTVGF